MPEAYSRFGYFVNNSIAVLDIDRRGGISQLGYMKEDNLPMSRIREIRLNRGYTLTRAAELCEMAPPTFQKVDKGTNGVSKNLAPGFAKGLQVAIQDLYAPVGAPIPDIPIDVAKISPQQGGQFVHDAEQLMLLALWDVMPISMRKALMAMAVTLAQESARGPKDTDLENLG